MTTIRRSCAMTIWAVAVALCHGVVAVAADASSPGEIRKKLDEAKALVDDGKPAKARGIVAAAAVDLAHLAELEKAPSGFRSLVDRCSELKDAIELEGVDVSGIAIPQVKSPRGGSETARAPAAKPTASSAPAISFTRQVAPLLVTHCGGCHVTGRKGGFQMASYDALMKTGVVQRGVGDASRLVEVIVTGDMPRGGGKVAQQELATLVAWINAGAPFDGPDPTAPLGRGTGAAAPAPAGMTTAATAPVPLKPGNVSFAFDVAPVLIKNCVGCHDDTQPEARLSMTSFARLARGGESGAPFVAGRGADSLLVRKIKGASGIEGQRMPIGKPPLSAEVIGLIEKWIDQGATLDLLNANAGLADLAAAGRARSLSHEDLRQARFAAAEKLWRRALPDEEPTITRFDDVIVIGNLSRSRLDEIAGPLEQAVLEARKYVVDGDGPILKGGVACFLMAKPYDFSNFRETIVGEERPKGMLGDAGVAGDVAYGAVIVPATTADASSGDDVATLATEQIVAAAFVGRNAPRWFAQGAGRAVAAKAAPKSTAAKGWRQEAADATARLGAPEDFFGGHAGPVAQAAIGGGFVTALAPSPAKLKAIVERLDTGMAFDAAFAEVFKSPPQPLFTAWAAKESRKPAGRR